MYLSEPTTAGLVVGVDSVEAEESAINKSSGEGRNWAQGSSCKQEGGQG